MGRLSNSERQSKKPLPVQPRAAVAVAVSAPWGGRDACATVRLFLTLIFA
jgi:hypothetical protein